MKEELQILMIDDHPLIIEGYKNVLMEHYGEKWNVIIEVAHDCDEALRALKKQTSQGNYKLALVDIELPRSINQKEIEYKQFSRW